MEVQHSDVTWFGIRHLVKLCQDMRRQRKWLCLQARRWCPLFLIICFKSSTSSLPRSLSPMSGSLTQNLFPGSSLTLVKNFQIPFFDITDRQWSPNFILLVLDALTLKRICARSSNIIIAYLLDRNFYINNFESLQHSNKNEPWNRSFVFRYFRSRSSLLPFLNTLYK